MMFDVFLTCVLLLQGFSGVDSEKVSVMEGDSVTLHTGIKTNQDRMNWFFNGIRIARISEDQSKICEDAECPERFRDRLKLDNVTGSLTITDITNTDSGEYRLDIISRRSEKTFSVSVHDAPAADREEIKSVKEGESVTLDPGVMNNTNYLITFLFNDVLIAEISEDQSKTCTDVQCEDSDERFRDRLKVNQTGSLTITDITNTDSGEYKLQITISSSSSFSIRRSRSFSLTVTGSGLSLSVVAGICAAVVILLVTAAAAGVMYLKQKKRRGAEPKNDQTNTMRYSTVNQTENATIGSSYKRTETATEKPV